MKRIHYYIFVALISFISACKSSIQPEKPSVETANLEYVNDISRINVPFEISINQLEKKINAQTGDVLYHDKSFTNNDNESMLGGAVLDLS